MKFLGKFGALWGIVGVCMLLGSAIYRLGQYAIESLQMELSLLQWIACVLWVVFMGMSEGYRGFQKAFSPRVVARALYLSRSATLLRVILAPAFCMGFFHATKKRKIVTWCLTLGLVVLVILVRQLEQPWRGIIDLGVVVGLGWGVLAIFYFCYNALMGKHVYDPEVPE